MGWNRMKQFSVMGAILIFTANASAVSFSSHFQFEGQLLDGVGNPIVSSSNVTFEIYDPGLACLIYKETHSGVIPDAQGNFVLMVGTGTRDTTSDGGVLWSKLFRNGGQVRAAGSNCAGGYTPASGDGRMLEVTVNGTTLSPAFAIAPVPMANVAEVAENLNGNAKIGQSDMFLLLDSSGINSVELKAPGGLGSSLSLVLPANTGSAGNVLSTDGAGILSWIAPASGGGAGTVTNVTGNGPISVATGTTTPDISIAQASSSASGYLSSADWNAFNSKGNGTITAVTGGGVLTASTAGGVVNMSISAAGSGVSGYLGSGDWSIFNNKVGAVAASAPLFGNVTGGVLNLSMPQASSGVSGYISAGDWANFNSKGNGTITAVNGTGPLTASTAGGVVTLSMGVAGSGVGGWLSAGDWSNFNNKMSSVGGTALANGQIWVGNASGLAAASPALYLNSGGAGSPIYSFSSGVTTGMFSPAVNDIGFSTAATERMRIKNNGFVGIGTTTPIAPFHLNAAVGGADAIISSPGASQLLLTGSSAASYPGVAISHTGGAFHVKKVTSGSADPTYSWADFNGTNGVFNLTAVNGAATDAKLALRRANNIAPMGGGLPLGKVSFEGWNGSGYSNMAAGIISMSTQAWTGGTNGADLHFMTTQNGFNTPTERMMITDMGDVGIGTNMPAARLDVAGSIRVANDGSGCSVTNEGAIRWNGSNFEGCDGSAWMIIGMGGGGGGIKVSNQTWCGGSPSSSAIAVCNYSATGAAIGDNVICNPRGQLPVYADYYCYVNAPNQVQLVVYGTSSSPTGLGGINWDFKIVP